MKTFFIYFILLTSTWLFSQAQDSTGYILGYESYTKMKFNDAIYWFSKSIEKNRYRVSDSYRYRGMSYAFERNFESAKKDLMTSYNLDSLNTRIDYQIGKFYYLQDKFDSSIIWYTKAIQKNNKDADFFDSRALAYAGANQLNKAMDDAKKAVSFNPNSDVYLNNLGLIKQKQLKYKEALEDFDKVLHIDSSMVNNLSTYINISFCHLKLGEYKKALQECNEVLKQFPNTPYALLVRGQANKALLKTKEACDDFILLYSIDSTMGKEYVEKYCKDKLQAK